MEVMASGVALTVEDVEASAAFFERHFGYRRQMSADGFASLTHDGAAIDVSFMRRGLEILPEDQRDQRVSGLIVALVVADLEAELTRLSGEGVVATLPLQEEEWGERLFQVTDPNGVVVELVEWVEGAGPDTWTP